MVILLLFQQINPIKKALLYIGENDALENVVILK